MVEWFVGFVAFVAFIVIVPGILGWIDNHSDEIFWIGLELLLVVGSILTVTYGCYFIGGCILKIIH